MRALSFTSLTSVALLAAVVSCDSTPAEPPGVEAAATTPLFKADQAWVTGSFFADNVLYVECLGENVRFYGEVPYRWHRVFKPSGGYSDFFALAPSTPQQPFLAEGLSSGIVWEARGSIDPEMYRAGPGEVVHISYRETYVSSSGPTFHVKGGTHVTINANGDVTAFRDFYFEQVCTGRG
jgi:hypothetical protein